MSPQVQAEIKQLEGEIGDIESETLRRLTAPPDNQVQQIELLDKLPLQQHHRLDRFSLN
jgi:cytochrome c peroxidase